jgi:hypothetical protein
MSFRLSRFLCWAAVAAVSATGILESAALAQGTTGRRRTIGLSETNSSEVFTNLFQLYRSQDRSRKAREAPTASRVPLSGDPGVAGSAPYRPSVRANTSNRTTKEQTEWQKKWNLTPEDTLPNSSSDAVFGLRELEGDKTDRKNKSSSLQQFYEILKAQEGANKSSTSGSAKPKDDYQPGSSQRFSSDPERRLEEDENLPPTIRENAGSLQKMLSEDQSPSVYNPGTMKPTSSDLFGLGVTLPSRKEELERKANIQEYQKMLDGIGGSIAPTPSQNPLLDLNSLNAASSATSPGYRIGQGMQPATKSPFDGLSSGPGNYRSILAPLTTPDLGGNALNQWNPMYTPQRAEPPKPVMPLSSGTTMDFPRRRF